jgi:hypothetical protein
VTAAVEAPVLQPPPVARTWIATAASFAVMVLAALTPITAVLTAGWLARRARAQAQVAMGVPAQPAGVPHQTPEALLSSRDLFPRSMHQQVPVRVVGSIPATRAGLTLGMQRLAQITSVAMRLYRLIEDGLRHVLGVGLVSLPHVTLMGLGWWAGWENSFNKGYEQAWVGPTLVLSGMLLGSLVSVHLPMLMAQGVAERRLSAYLDVPASRRLVRAAGWGYVALTLSTVLALLPLLALQASIAFFFRKPSVDPADVVRQAGVLHLLATAYLVLVLIVLRGWRARLYGRARLILEAEDGRARWTLGAKVVSAVRFLICALAWAVAFAALVVAQFANHAWWSWMNLPVLGLPWVFRVF